MTEMRAAVRWALIMVWDNLALMFFRRPSPYDRLPSFSNRMTTYTHGRAVHYEIHYFTTIATAVGRYNNNNNIILKFQSRIAYRRVSFVTNRQSHQIRCKFKTSESTPGHDLYPASDVR